MASSEHRRKPRKRRVAAFLGAAAMSTPLICSAANTDTYIGTSGTNWNNNNDWGSVSSHLVPAAGDTVSITESPSSLFSVTYDGSYTSLTAIGSLTLDGSSTNGVVLNQATAGDNLFSGTEYIGNGGISTYNQTAATHSVSGALYLGYNTTGQGTYLLGGAANLAASTLVVGDLGTGTFTQTGGTATSSNNLYVGFGSGSSGIYSLSSTGSLTVGAYEFLGTSGTASFVQSGGTHIVSTWLFVGYSSGGGSYTLSGGLLAPYKLSVGYAGTGTFTQTGGTDTITNYLTVGDQTSGTGSYILSGGTLSAFGENIPFIGAGAFIQTGGSNAVAGDLAVGGSQSGATGSYSLSSTGAVTVGGNTYVGGNSQGTNGSGILAISGGSMSVAGTLKVWNHSGTSVTLSGGTLSLAALDLSGRPMLFNWSGGTLNFTSPTTIDANFALGPSIQLGPAQNLSTSATLTNNGQVTLAGGALAGSGSLINGTGQITGYGAIGGSGGFTNAGQLIQSGGALTLSNTGANSNSGNVSLSAGNQFQLTGGALANSGTINVNGATITGSAQLTNGVGGVITGSGAITSPLSNGGTIALAAGTLSLPAFTNGSTGTVAVGGIAAAITGGALVNNGAVNGFGTITNPITNNNTIEPIGGKLILAGTITNPASGLITAATGTQAFFSQGLGTNHGLISLTGGTIDTNNSTLTNSGTLSGYGVLRTGSLLNNAEMELAGGTATVNGPVTNAGRVDVKYATAVFNSPVTNNAGATFKITGGSVAFVGTFTNNGIYSSDPADNHFTDLTISTTGALQGGAGDRFVISGDLLSASTQNAVWDTASSLIDLQGAVLHRFSVTGTDQGAEARGYINNFAVGALELDAGGSLSLQGVGADPALYVGALDLPEGLGQISSIDGNGVSLYYDSSNPANAYLGDQTFALPGGGELAPVPEPSGGLLMGITAVLSCRRRRPLTGDFTRAGTE